VGVGVGVGVGGIGVGVLVGVLVGVTEAGDSVQHCEHVSNTVAVQFKGSSQSGTIPSIK
jgi:hypothetical protein